MELATIVGVVTVLLLISASFASTSKFNSSSSVVSTVVSTVVVCAALLLLGFELEGDIPTNPLRSLRLINNFQLFFNLPNIRSISFCLSSSERTEDKIYDICNIRAAVSVTGIPESKSWNNLLNASEKKNIYIYLVFIF